MFFNPEKELRDLSERIGEAIFQRGFLMSKKEIKDALFHLREAYTIIERRKNNERRGFFGRSVRSR